MTGQSKDPRAPRAGGPPGGRVGVAVGEGAHGGDQRAEGKGLPGGGAEGVIATG